MAEPADPRVHVLGPEARTFDRPDAAAARAPARVGRVRRLPNGDLVQAHRYEDELARMQAEDTTLAP